MLKGNTKIELTDVSTGNTKTIEKHNLITNAINDLLESKFGDAPMLYKMAGPSDSIAQTIFGNIILFKNQLTESPDDYYLPNLDITGWAASNVYNDVDQTRGSYNANESGPTTTGDGKNGYKFVWDFATNQANGTINAVALTTKKYEQICPSPYTTDYVFVGLNDGFSKVINGGKVSNSNITLACIYNDFAFAIDTDKVQNAKNGYIEGVGYTLNLYKYNVRYKNIGISNNFNGADLIEQIDVKFKKEFCGTGDKLDVNFDNGKLYVWRNCDLQPSASMEYAIIDFSDNYKVTYKTFTNNSTQTIYTSNDTCLGRSYRMNSIFITEKRIIFISSPSSWENGKIYIEDADDNTNIKEVKDANGDAYVTPKGYYFAPIFIMDNVAFVINRSTNEGSYPSYYRGLLIDLTSAKVYQCLPSRFSSNGSSTVYGNSNVVKLDNKVYCLSTATNLGISPLFNPFILTTKNNLDEAVTKTASQTMKITYTITEE